MSESKESFEGVGSVDDLGGGAYFWVYLSPQKNTAEIVKDWTVTLTQGDWSASIDSGDDPPVLKTHGKSGIFDVRVIWRQPPSEVVVELKPSLGSKPNIGCGEECGAMIGIVAGADGAQPTYWTVWNAICKQGNGEDG